MTGTLLDQILDDARDRAERLKRTTPISALEGRDSFSAERRDFTAALRRDDLAVIAEIKRQSPSKGPLRPGLDPNALAAEYAEAGAAAVSVLTEPDHFAGSLRDLEAARRAVAVPLLRKDFIVDEVQLFEARAHGADAVLLIAAALDPVHLRDLQDAAHGLGLAALVEVHAERELDRLDFDRTQVLGVNNRDLRTFEVNPKRAERVFRHVPLETIRVAESGLAT
ncbi:MAG: indole-3-glycerol phosphate synthase TrpC, partial [Rhodothermales bacterium]|nr:indole-3-glycerol phosphate synthase TrpC [Rhodothermales bacterium]